MTRIVVRLSPAFPEAPPLSEPETIGPEKAGPEKAAPESAHPDRPVLPVFYTPGQTLAQAVYLSGLVRPPALCSGLSLCGRCRMRLFPSPAAPLVSLPEPLAAETRVFDARELADGWRLACRHTPWPGLMAELPADSIPTGFSVGDDNGTNAAQRQMRASEGRAGPATDKDAATAAQAPCADRPFQRRHPVRRRNSGPLLDLAVDLGTTSVQWQFQDAADAAPAAAVPVRMHGGGAAVNPQMGAGSDVLSRLAVAAGPAGPAGPGGRERLQALTLNFLRDLVHKAPGETRALCLAANPAMTAITLGRDVSGLATAPYRLDYAGGCREILPGLPRLWIPPQISPFVGGDISAGYAALALGPALGPPGLGQRPLPPYPFLLADMGTNGEFLLALSPQRALAASVALGPALEGIGLSCGSEARPLAATGFTLTPAGLTALILPEPSSSSSSSSSAASHSPTVIPAPPGLRPAGITGTGAISLLHLLLQSRAMDADGRFTPERSGPLRRFLTPFPDADGRYRLPLPGGLGFTAADVEETLKVKAAFSLGLHRLLEAAGLGAHQLRAIFLAGALGLHVHKPALETLGFFPPGLAARLDAVGNSSLAGASLLLQSATTRTALVEWAARVETLDLGADPAFVRDYTSHMRFVW